MLSFTMKAFTVKKIETPADPATKKLFWNLFGTTRGAPNRIRIMSHLRNRPSNPNQLSKEIEIDYKGIIHHLKTLEEYNLVEKFGNRGITTFFTSPMFEKNEQVFDEIVANV
jgi:predicted transcriptional regulator